MRRLSRAKRNVIRRLNAQLDRLCSQAQMQILARLETGKPYEEIAAPIGRRLYSDAGDIKRKLKALGVKGINV